MYISHLTIKNFRNFAQFDTDLYPFTLIVGENNTGKSNLLEALCLIFGQEITIYKKRALEIDDINYQVIKEFKEQIIKEGSMESIKFPEVQIEVTMTDFNEDQEAVVGDWYIDKDLKQAKLTYLFSIRQGWRGKEKWIKEQKEKLNIDLIDFPIDEYEFQIFGGNGQRSRVDFYFLKMLKMELLDALRDAKRELIASGDYRLLFRVLNNRDHSKYKEIQKSLVDLKNIVDNDIEFKTVKKEIKDYLDKIALHENDMDNGVNFKFSSPEMCEILKKLSLIYGVDPIGVERNGLGRNNLLFISLILSHLTGENCGANQTFFRLIGIEEPEAHLHPHLQRHLSSRIKEEVKDNLQIILTSHSANISSKLDIDKTIILFKNNGKVEKHRLLDGLDKNSDTERYLRKFLNATNSEMFFAKKIILVEGISEQLLLSQLFKIYSNGNTLDQYGCNIVNVNGLAFSHFLEVIKNGYFIRCIVITDKDNPKNKSSEGRVKNLTEYEKDNDIIKICTSTESTFEKDLIETNKNGIEKTTLLDALCKTKTTNGPKFVKDTGTNDIDIELFFSEIKDYKSEFSLNLLDLVEGEKKSIKIPKYITDGFDHILNDKNNAPCADDKS